MSVNSAYAQASPRGGAGGRARAAITLAAAALTLAACSSPVPQTSGLPPGLSPAAASDAAVVTPPTAPAAATQTLSETGSSLMAPLFAQAYPIVNYEYAIVSTAQTSAVRAQDLRAFLGWAITSGAAQLARVNFQPLPSSVVTLSGAQIAKIKADT